MKFIFYFIHGANCKFSTSVDETKPAEKKSSVYMAATVVSTISMYMSGDTVNKIENYESLQEINF